MNLRLKTEPVNASADATVYVWFLPMGQTYGNKSRIYSVASAPSLTGSVLKQRVTIYLGQCRL